MINDTLESPAPVVILQQDGEWWRYTNPVRVIVAKRASEIVPAIQAIERAVEGEGLVAAGYITYEAGAAFGLPGRTPEPNGPPLLWFGLFRGGETIDPPARSGEYRIGEWQPSIDIETYEAAIRNIKDAIAAGDTYQVNYTFHLRASFEGDPRTLFASLTTAQRAAFCAYIDLGRFAICSASPELFFRLDGSFIESRPMKGTAPRGLTLADDRRQAEELRQSEKNRAENVMIVDMIRNDLGRIALTGSVHVPQLFTIEHYPTLLQMTSVVKAQTDTPLSEILAAMFPCASITGAPKVSTMRIIHSLEPEPRGVYTGSIGYFAPGQQAQFNVAIRTAVIDRVLGIADYGVGSGIVWDSDATAEYEECLLKARVLQASTESTVEFCLLESMRWTPAEGYFLQHAHLERLENSAEYFGFPYDNPAIAQSLVDLAATLVEASKVRLLLGRRGEIFIEALPLTEGMRKEPIRVGLAHSPVDSNDFRLYHKTTRREVYDEARLSRPDCDDIILWNERGELTEASTANIVLQINGRQYTPPVVSGLLAGTYRGYLLESGEIEERRLDIADLYRATKLWLINSARGRMLAIMTE